MARITGPKCKICRREGKKLYLKGARCHTDKCAMNRKPYPPGQHGKRRSRRMSSYGKQFREKQQIKRIYGVLEKQFKKYVKAALNTEGVTGENLIQLLEARFDNMVYRSGFATSRNQARQFIRAGLFKLNGKDVNIPSVKIEAGDKIEAIDLSKIHLRQGFVLPEWLEANVQEASVEIKRLPNQDEVAEDIDVQLIVEFYSR